MLSTPTAPQGSSREGQEPPVGAARSSARLWIACGIALVLVIAAAAADLMVRRREAVDLAQLELRVAAMRAVSGLMRGESVATLGATLGPDLPAPVMSGPISISIEPGPAVDRPDVISACEPLPARVRYVCASRPRAAVLRFWQDRSAFQLVGGVIAALGVLAVGLMAANELRQSRLRARRLGARLSEVESALQRLTVGVAVFDSEGRLAVANGRFQTLLDLPARLCRRGVSLRAILHHQAVTGEFGPKAQTDPSREAGRRFDAVMAMREWRASRRRPSGRWIELERGPTPDGGVAIVYHDVTAQRAAEEAARLAHARLEEAIATVPVGFSLWDADDRLVMFNRRFMETHSYLAAVPDPHGLTYAAVTRLGHASGQIRPDPADDIEASIARRIELHRHPPDAALERLLGDGRWYLVRTRRTGDGSIVQVASEITRLKEVEAELVERVDDLELSQRRLGEQAERLARMAADYAQARDEAEAASRAKSRFLANMSHELRTPLNAVIGFSEIIKSELLGPVGTPQYAEYAADIHASGQHLLALINDLLDMSKIEAGRYDLWPEPVDLSEIAADVWRMLGIQADQRGVAVALPPDGAGPVIEADRRSVRQILLNLLSNAIKFTERGGHVAVDLQSDGEWAALRVADTGIGIDEEALARIGRPFEQGDNELSRRHEGTGLGLALSRALAELHGGTLLIDSRLGHGTVVTVRLPAVARSTAHAELRARAASAA